MFCFLCCYCNAVLFNKTSRRLLSWQFKQIMSIVPVFPRICLENWFVVAKTSWIQGRIGISRHFPPDYIILGWRKWISLWSHRRCGCVSALWCSFSIFNDFCLSNRRGQTTRELFRTLPCLIFEQENFWMGTMTVALNFAALVAGQTRFVTA